jgi:two-component system response regulator
MVSSHLIDILLVEDNPDDAALTLEALGEYRLSNRVHLAKDGAEALDFLFSRGAYTGRPEMPLKLVMLDIKLPKVDGLEVLRAIREDPRTAELPVVMLTSSQEDADIRKGYGLRANSYIVKPVDFDQFIEAVKEIGMYWAILNRPPVLPGAPIVANDSSHKLPAGRLR